MPSPATCPNCGADVPRGAKACPECGSCEETGWSDEAATSDLGLPEEEFNYEDFARREFGSRKRPPMNISPFWWLVALAVAILLAVLLFK